MGRSELGPWEPLALTDVVELFSAAPFRWWVSGGVALELHLGRSWREHSDTDLGMVRNDVPELRSVLAGWEVQIAAAGALSPWDGGPVAAERSQNNLWCRRDLGSSWRLDVTVGEGDQVDWIYRRDPSLRVPWADAVLTTPDRIPYLAPELQLLFKSKDVRAKDDFDAHEVIPALGHDRRARLAARLRTDHPWQALLAERR